MIRALTLILAASQQSDSVDALIQRTMESQKIPGLTLVVQQNGRIVKNRSYGLADIAAKKPAALQTVYETGSIGKSFTAVLVMQLVQKGKLKLDDPIVNFLPEAPAKWSGIKIRHLLSQQSGLPEYALMPGIGLADTYDRKKFFEGVTGPPLDFETGKMFQYSNTNFALLGYIVEKATGQPYGKLVTENVIKRAGLERTYFLHGASEIPGMALGYMLDQALVPQTGPKTTTSGSGADGSFASTAGDLLRFAGALESGRLLPKSVVAQMMEGAPTLSGRRAGYGLGFFVRRIDNKRFISHGGNSVGFSASMAMFPDSRLKVTLMCNLYPVGGDNLARSIAEIYDPSLSTTGLKEQTDPHPKRSAWILEGLKALAKGEIDHAAIDPEFTSMLKTGRGGMMRGGFAPFGAFERLAYQRTEPDGSDETIRYRAYAGERKFGVVVTVTKGHQILSVASRPE